MSKIKPSPKLYTFQANVFNNRIGPACGTTTNITISANNEKDAYEQAKIFFDKYINALYIRHNINGKIRKIFNVFDYNNLKIV